MIYFVLLARDMIQIVEGGIGGRKCAERWLTLGESFWARNVPRPREIVDRLNIYTLARSRAVTSRSMK